ncbi:phospho-N-acetylmuramoyl-pentapeptide-transferase [candidate division KSB1 bacterium]|nr:phospho-N-acetylmuramoyl-pentapeptide-transferase [candidate division KSB1 bacterium]
MFYYLLYPLRDAISGLNIFKYISFRSLLAAITALFICFVIGPKIIDYLRRKQIGEEIRGDGPQTHLIKRGTPTMGGLIILIAVLVPTLLWSRVGNTYILLLILSTLWMGVVGFIDDYLKVVKKKSKGLIGRYKLAGQIILGLIIGVVIMMSPAIRDDLRTAITLPFFTGPSEMSREFYIDIGLLYLPFVIFIITATSNSVNLTDGLDGLAIGLVGIVAGALAVISYVAGHIKFSEYLIINYLPNAGEMAVYCAALVGASIGFLWYNTHPAQVFMGDTGSLALGSALGTLFILAKKELLLLILGGVFVAESLSVIIQVAYFKRTKKRVFLMAPIHHHFELKGWHESQVVTRFWIMGILLALIALSTFKIR